MTTILLGHTGFIGKHIFYLFKKNKKKILGGNSKNCNLLKKKQIINFFKNLKNFNLIICSSLVRSKQDNIKSFNNNILMIINLLSSLDEKKINKIIFLSSIDVYSQKNVLKENSTPTIPRNKYGLYKLISENLLKTHFNKRKLIILRLSGVYDDNINGKNMISYIKRGLKKKSLKINSSGKELRDFIHAEDVAKISYFFLQSNLNGIFNVATGKSNNIRYYVNKIYKKNFLNYAKINYDLKNKLQDVIVNVSKLKRIFPLSKLKKIK